MRAVARRIIIPGALAGAAVDFWAEGYATQSVGEWDGAQLNLKFVRDSATATTR